MKVSLLFKFVAGADSLVRFIATNWKLLLNFAGYQTAFNSHPKQLSLIKTLSLGSQRIPSVSQRGMKCGGFEFRSLFPFIGFSLAFYIFAVVVTICFPLSILLGRNKSFGLLLSLIWVHSLALSRLYFTSCY